MHGDTAHSETATTSSTAPKLTVSPRITLRCTAAGAMYVAGAAGSPSAQACPDGHAHSGVTHRLATPSGRSKPVTP